MKHIVMAVVMTGLMATPARAQDVVHETRPEGVVSPNLFKVSFGAPQAAAPEPKKVTVLIGSDFPSLYMFRGIRQESDANVTMQPYVDIGIAAAENVTLNVGLWNSLHTGTSGTGCECDRSAFYETDFYASLTFTAGKLKPGVLFTSYTSPNDAFSTVNELAGVLSIDDSANAVPLSPKIVLAFELADGQADGGGNKGAYFEFGIKPTFKPGGTVSVGVPLKVGMSLKDYYEGPEGDSKFGYVQAGVVVSVPLSGMTAGAWEVHGGVDIYSFGKTLKAFNADDRGKVVASAGFSVTF